MHVFETGQSSTRLKQDEEATEPERVPHARDVHVAAWTSQVLNPMFSQRTIRDALQTEELRDNIYFAHPKAATLVGTNKLHILLDLLDMTLGLTR